MTCKHHEVLPVQSLVRRGDCRTWQNLFTQAGQKPRATGVTGKTTKSLLGLCFALFFKWWGEEGGWFLLFYFFGWVFLSFLKSASELPPALLVPAEMEAGECLPTCLLQRNHLLLLRRECAGEAFILYCRW